MRKMAFARVVAGVFLALGTGLPPAANAQGVVFYADTLLQHGKGVTVDSQFSVVQAVAIREGKIVAVGSNDDVQRWAGPQTRVIDLQGKTVLPGFVDTHSHPHEGGLDRYAGQAVPELRPQIVQGKNYEDFLTGIRGVAARTKPGQWAIVRLQPADLANDFWLKHSFRDMDKVAAGKLILIDQGTRGLLTSEGLLMFKNRYGGQESELLRLPSLVDEKGQPTGRFRAEVVRVIKTDLIMNGKKAILADTYYKLMLDLAKFGITTWSSTLQPLQAREVFAELNRQGKMSTRLAYTHASGFQSFADAVGFYERLGAIQGFGTDYMWLIGASPANNDGSYPNICTSITSVPKEIKEREQCFSGPGTFKREAMEAIVRAGNRITGLHISGDKVLDQLMDAIEAGSKAAGMTEEEIRARRHATDHCDYNPRPDQVQRAVKLGLYFSCKASTLFGDGYENFIRDYGEKYLGWLSPINSILEAGGKVVVELDRYPSEDRSAFLDLQTWITRKDSKGNVINADERIDRQTALKMLTIWAAEYVLRENLIGSLEAGKWADLIVLDKDYLTVPEDQIKEIKVLLTLLGGRPTHAAGEFASLSSWQQAAR
ncbi:MAG: amidohydrolase family protein [Acidobacteria bacterium]|nr:amidohydrolase family protein [Acidobacteriota bacterium]